MSRRTLIGLALVTLALILATALTLAGARSTRASALAQVTDQGVAIYTERCEVCHGAEGDGNGPAAANLDPKPRDFRRGWYKIRTTASGQLPTDEDLAQVIADGMPGTSMPAWEGVLSEQEIAEVAAYIKTFARRFERETPALAELGPSVSSGAESIQRGRELFEGQQAECVKCHGEAGRGDGPSANELTDDFGNVIVPADLTMAWLFRGGPAAEAIYRRLETGLTGSPMPSYADVLSDEDLWHLANYVDSLSPDTLPEPSAAMTASQVPGTIPGDAGAAEWQAAAEVYVPLVGQIMREPRNYTPSVKGLWVRALYNESELALLVRWHDRFQDSGAEGEPADALAIQFPAQLPEGDERPYFVFGDSANPVNLWHWNAAANLVEERTGRGVGAVTAQPAQNAQGSAAFTDGEYTLIVRRALRTGDPEDLQIEAGRFIPVGFMAWDGWRGEQDESGAISPWQLIYLDRPVPAVTYAWIPGAAIVAAALEWWLVRTTRRANVKRKE